MKHFHLQAINNATGLPIASPTFTVYFQGVSSPLPSIYSDEGVTTKANPFTGDSLGRGDFYASDGDYDVKVEGSGVTAYILSDVTIADEKRVTQVALNDDAFLLVNAYYDRNAAQWKRINTSKPALAFGLQGSNFDAYFYFAPSGSNPISSWLIVAQIGGVLSAAGNYAKILAAAAGFPPEVQAQGTDTNVDLRVVPKGTGMVRPKFTGASAKRGSNVSLTGASDNLVSWDQEDYDTGPGTNGFHEGTINPSRLTVPIAGFYQVEAIISVDGNQALIVKLRKNGTTEVARVRVANATTTGTYIAKQLQLAANDYIEVLANPAVTVNLVAAESHAAIRYIGE